MLIGGASAATVRSSKSKFAIYTCIVRRCESTLQAVAIGGWLQSERSRVRALLWNSVVVFFSLLFPPLSFSPFHLFPPSLPFISPPSFFPFMPAPPLQCSSIFLVTDTPTPGSVHMHNDRTVADSSTLNYRAVGPGFDSRWCILFFLIPFSFPTFSHLLCSFSFLLFSSLHEL